jgi:hypothetical protein
VYPYDPALLAAVQSVPRTVADVLEILHAIDGICVELDGLKWFNGLYLQVTEAVQARIAAGGFMDLPWLAELDVQFAQLYFAALQSGLAGRAAPTCWKILFDRRNQPAIARIQFALAGMNAHINHDLAEAIVTTCQATGAAPDRSGTHYADYTALNSTLDGLIEAAKRTLNVRLPGDALPPVSHLEDTLAAWGVSAARESAWTSAERLWEVRTIPAAASGFMDALDGFATVIGKAVLVPVP